MKKYVFALICLFAVSCLLNAAEHNPEQEATQATIEKGHDISAEGSTPKQLQGENNMLKVEDRYEVEASGNSCTGNECCCQMGSYGTCYDRKKCEDNVGTCVSSAPGCR